MRYSLKGEKIHQWYLPKDGPWHIILTNVPPGSIVLQVYKGNEPLPDCIRGPSTGGIHSEYCNPGLKYTAEEIMAIKGNFLYAVMCLMPGALPPHCSGEIKQSP